LPAPAAARGERWAGVGDAGDNFVVTIAGFISAVGALVPLAVSLVIVFLGLQWGRRRWRAAKAGVRT
jgi:hypothetical protein